jgi:UPF0755 protein
MRFFVPIVVYSFTCAVICVLGGIAPAEKQTHELYFIIESGQSAKSVAHQLGTHGLVRFPLVFELLLTVTANQSNIKAGTYYIENPQNMLTMVKRLTQGMYDITPLKVTIIEGSNVFEIADILAPNLPDFDSTEFIKLAFPYEGFLFPDTYLLSPDMTEQNIIDLLRTTFNQKTKHIFAGLSESEIYELVTLASLVEEETYTSADRPIVAGILRHRLEIGMPLQVDVTFQYINGKNSYNLTLEDLKHTSLYNTYVHKGLPPTPISNPSLESLEATRYYTVTEYLYFLSSRSGVMYYGRTFEEHKSNRKYL